MHLLSVELEEKKLDKNKIEKLAEFYLCFCLAKEIILVEIF
jgi:hypothetical protein